MTEEANKIFGQCLEQLREQFNINKNELARILNKTRSMIGYYESGKRVPSFDILLEISDYFNVSLDWLIGKSDIQDIGHRKGQIPLGRTVKIPIISPTLNPEARLNTPENTVGYADFPSNMIKEEEEYICTPISQNSQQECYVLIRLKDTIVDGELTAVELENQIKLHRMYKANGSFFLCSENQESPQLLKRKDFRVIGRVEVSITFHKQKNEQNEQSIQV